MQYSNEHFIAVVIKSAIWNNKKMLFSAKHQLYI